MAANGVDNSAPVIPNAVPMASSKKSDDIGWMFMVVDLSLGIKKSEISSLRSRKKIRHHNAVAGLTESATKVGGIAIM